MSELIKETFEHSQNIYGSPCIAQALNNKQHNVSRILCSQINEKNASNEVKYIRNIQLQRILTTVISQLNRHEVKLIEDKISFKEIFQWTEFVRNG